LSGKDGFQPVRVSIVIPVLDEEATIGPIVATCVRLRRRRPEIAEIVVVDSGSTDHTAAVARAAGARVVDGAAVLPELGHRPGKGEVLWKGLAVTTGDVVVYVDGDLRSFTESYVRRLVAPFRDDPAIQLVKGYYDRSADGTAQHAGGGRVTELTARPLLNLLFPELADVVQPLGGEYAGRRELLEALPYDAGYAVDAGLLIDTYRRHGRAAIGQVDLGHREHRHQELPALGRMAFAVAQAILRRADPGILRGESLRQFSHSGPALLPHPAGDPGLSESVFGGPGEPRPPLAEVRGRLSGPQADGKPDAGAPFRTTYTQGHPVTSDVRGRPGPVFSPPDRPAASR
jgi:glucosyl-3-phosphoglycerate synthase